jgi:hypothetical protein
MTTRVASPQNKAITRAVRFTAFGPSRSISHAKSTSTKEGVATFLLRTFTDARAGVSYRS